MLSHEMLLHIVGVAGDETTSILATLVPSHYRLVFWGTMMSSSCDWGELIVIY